MHSLSTREVGRLSLDADSYVGASDVQNQLKLEVSKGRFPFDPAPTLFEGKMIRASLLISLGREVGVSPRIINSVVKSVECLHEASLCHDDIQDRQEERRGSPTAWKQWGIEQAISLGDWLLNHSSRQLQELPSTEFKNALALHQDCVASMLEGQMLEQDLRGRSFTIDLYERIVALKTGSLLRLGPCLLGLFSHRAVDPRISESMEQLALAYQKSNDLRDVRNSSSLDLINRTPTRVVTSLWSSADFHQSGAYLRSCWEKDEVIDTHQWSSFVAEGAALIREEIKYHFGVCRALLAEVAPDTASSLEGIKAMMGIDEIAGPH